MKKFTKLKDKKEDYIFSGATFNVAKTDGWEIVVEKDSVIIIPHFIENNEVLIRKEWIPTYRYREPEKEYFLTVISGTMEDGEDDIQAIRRELQEETGIQLNTLYSSFKKLGEFYLTKGNCGKYRVYYLPIGVNDYTRTVAMGDGSEAEEKSFTVRLDLKFLNDVIAPDMVTAYSLEKLKGILKQN